MLIEINKVTKRFSKKLVLDQITLSVGEGEIFCLLGPSGAGKTTLIRLVTGAIAADEGEIIIDGRKIPDMDIIKRVGFMPQNDAVYNDISGKDNLIFFGGLFGLKGKELNKRADDMLELVGLSEDAKKLVMNYSGGMKKRLSLAASLMHNPKILVLDEPTVGIDPVLRKAIWDEFDRLRKDGTTILVTTHVMDEAEKCVRAGLIYNGHLIACGTIKELLAKTENGSIEELFFMAKEA
ncbi:MAG: ABC transporter ATP-binding protein [Clostridia bacterium]|nr:ABC transporter ATP-binding protein [Clostridia bacterium]